MALEIGWETKATTPQSALLFGVGKEKERKKSRNIVLVVDRNHQTQFFFFFFSFFSSIMFDTNRMSNKESRYTCFISVWSWQIPPDAAETTWVWVSLFRFSVQCLFFIHSFLLNTFFLVCVALEGKRIDCEYLFVTCVVQVD